MIYKNKIILFLFILPFLDGCAGDNIFALDKDEVWHSHRPMLVMREKVDDKKEMKENAPDLLDELLSPFEDMTEYALDNDVDGMNKTLADIKENQNRYKNLDNGIKQLELSVEKHNYQATALISTRLFKKNIDNFSYSSYIKEQIQIENLDYMGFEILALLNQKNIDFAEIETLIIASKEHWLALKDKVKNKNNLDSFELLFKGLELSAKNKDVKMLQIWASMDLSLVDILEIDFK
ncbi:MAG: hypothetical protein L3J19_00690 [Sulfurimonas sp.]|nr:hypothetical protein [Sulfurimonas sp.]